MWIHGGKLPRFDNYLNRFLSLKCPFILLSLCFLHISAVLFLQNCCTSLIFIIYWMTLFSQPWMNLFLWEWNSISQVFVQYAVAESRGKLTVPHTACIYSVKHVKPYVCLSIYIYRFTCCFKSVFSAQQFLSNSNDWTEDKVSFTA